jgi:hypothetical protein
LNQTDQQIFSPQKTVYSKGFRAILHKIEKSGRISVDRRSGRGYYHSVELIAVAVIAGSSK